MYLYYIFIRTKLYVRYRVDAQTELFPPLVARRGGREEAGDSHQSDHGSGQDQVDLKGKGKSVTEEEGTECQEKSDTQCSREASDGRPERREAAPRVRDSTQTSPENWEWSK